MIVGICGRAGAGKSTVAEILSEDHGFREYSLAAPLKEMLHTLNPVVAHDWGENTRVQDWVDHHGWDGAKRSEPEIRRLLQVLGSDCIRAADPDFWVRALERRLMLEGGTAPVVVSDLRFSNEAQWVKDHNGTIIHVTRASADAEPPTHASEHGIPDHLVDFTVSNDGSIDDLREALKHVAVPQRMVLGVQQELWAPVESAIWLEGDE